MVYYVFSWVDLNDLAPRLAGLDLYCTAPADHMLSSDIAPVNILSTVNRELPDV